MVRTFNWCFKTHAYRTGIGTLLLMDWNSLLNMRVQAIIMHTLPYSFGFWGWQSIASFLPKSSILLPYGQQCAAVGFVSTALQAKGAYSILKGIRVGGMWLKQILWSPGFLTYDSYPGFLVNSSCLRRNLSHEKSNYNMAELSWPYSFVTLHQHFLKMSSTRTIQFMNGMHSMHGCVHTVPCARFLDLRCVLLLCLTAACGGAYLLEQPLSSVLGHYHRFEWMCQRMKVSRTKFN